MSFTADELQSFNDILEKKLSAHRREMERAFDQRLSTLRRDIEQRLIHAQQEIIRTLTAKLKDQQHGLSTTLSQKLTTQQIDIPQAVSNELRQKQQQQQQQWESIVDRSLAAQLLAIEELLNQRLALQPLEAAAVQAGENPPHIEAIEVQTELLWEDLIDVFGKALDKRFAALNESTLAAMKSWEQYLTVQLRVIQTQLRDEYLQKQGQSPGGNLTNMQEVFQSIEQLERIIESMQVAMTANHALLSNRLYHHQQLPLERAHPASHSLAQPANKVSGPLSLQEERGEQ